MTESLLDDEELGSSASTEKDDVVDDAVDDKADSSAADDSDDGELLSIVRDAVSAKDDVEEPAGPGSQPEEGEDSQQAELSNAEMDPETEEYKDVPFHKHRRFQQVLREKRMYKEAAQRAYNIDNFLNNVGLAPDEAHNLLEIGGLMKTHPREAWERMKPAVMKVMEAAGEILPPDLQQAVDMGDMSPEQAYQISIAKARANSEHTSLAWREQQMRQHQLHQQAESLRNAASSWQMTRQQTDPSFAQKLPLIMREVAFQQAQGVRAQTPMEVQAQLEKAYAAVTSSTVAPAAPAKQAKRPITGGQGGSAKPAAPATPMDIIQGVLAQREA